MSETAEQYPRVRFTVTPDVDAEVLYRFHLNVGKAYVAHDGFDAGVPDWRGTPGSVGGTEGYRTVRFTHLIDAAFETAGEALGTLARLLLADDGWLMVQLTEASRPVWFRTWRTTPGTLSLEAVRMSESREVVQGKFKIDLQLTADPYALGERIQLVAGGTVENDPAEPTNPHVLLLPEVKGDAPAPAVIEYDYATPEYSIVMVQTTPVPAGYTEPEVFQDDQVVLRSGYAASQPTADVAYSDGTYSTTDWNNPPTSGTAEVWWERTIAAGEWLALLRFSCSTAAVSFRAKLRQEFAGEISAIGGDDGIGSGQWLPIGIMRTPLTTAPDDVAAASTPSDTTLILELDRLSGTGDVRMDCLMLIPCPPEARTLYLSHFNQVLGWPPHVVDGEREAQYSFEWTGTGALENDNTTVAGGYPLLYPGRTNALHMIQGIGAGPSLGSDLPGGSGGSSLTDDATVDVYYRPRWLWLQP